MNWKTGLGILVVGAGIGYLFLTLPRKGAAPVSPPEVVVFQEKMPATPPGKERDMPARVTPAEKAPATGAGDAAVAPPVRGGGGEETPENGPLTAAADGELIEEIMLGQGELREIIQKYSAAAEAGDVSAQFGLGRLYQIGLKDVPRNDEEAVRWLTAAAKQGHAEAQFQLAKSYKFGHGVGPDYQAALNWYGAAAKQEYAPAQRSLGRMYEEGLGVLPDDNEAVRWYFKAAGQGDVDARKRLGGFLLEKRPVELEREQVVDWLRAAAEKGDDEATVLLEQLTETP